MRLLMAICLLLTMLAGCAADADEAGYVPWDGQPTGYVPWDPEAEAAEAADGVPADGASDEGGVGTDLDTPTGSDVCTAYNATHPASAPYHDSGSGLTWLDYCSSPWDPVTLTGYDERYRPTNDRTDGSPYGVHLSFVDDPRTTLTVTWFTADAAVDVTPTVVWGTSADGLDQTSEAASHAAYPGDPTISPLNPVDVAVHVATITGLEAGQTIWYRVEGTTGASPTYSAHTDPGPKATVDVMHWGDQHVIHDMSKRTTGLALEDLPDLIIIAGDLSYANGVQWLWDDYFWYFEPLFARVPVMAVAGNHEYKDGELAEGFRTRMSLPHDELQYSFQYGPAVFTMVDTEGGKLLAPAAHLEAMDPISAITSIPGGLQAYGDIPTFLGEAYMAKENGDAAFSFIVQHVPICSNHNSRGNAYQLTVLEEPWMMLFDVDLLMAGHNHMYERSAPMVGCSANSAGWVEIINGGGGQSLYEFAPEDQFQDWAAAWAERTTVVHYEIHPDEVYGYAWATDNPEPGDWELYDAWEIEL